MLTLHIFDKQIIYIKKDDKPIIINEWTENNINLFQLGFYLNLENKISNINLWSLTDFKNFNIDIIIYAQNNLIHINNINTNILINKNNFVYVKGYIFNNKINIYLIIDEISMHYNYIYDKIFKIFNFNSIKIILGGDKYMTSFKFNGKISYLNIIINDTVDKFNDLKNCYSKILVYHNFRNNIKYSNYFKNEVENGMFGSINGNNKYFDLYDIRIEENLKAGNKILIESYFENVNSHITLSNEFINFLSSLNKLSYSVYMSMKFFNDRCSEITNNFNYDFYFYKRKNLNFINRMVICINNSSFRYEIRLSNNLSPIKSGISDTLTYFKIILLKIFNIENNNYKITYIYKTNKTSSTDYHNFNEVVNESHIFLDNDKHYIGVFNYNNSTIIGNKWVIYELALILGTTFLEENNKIYTKLNDDKFILFCDENTVNIKSRINNYLNCENDNESGIKYPIDYCIIYNDSVCYKCLHTKKLHNNSCINKSSIYYSDEDYLENYQLFSHKYESNKEIKKEFTLDYGNILKKYAFYCNLGFNSERHIDIKIQLNDVSIKIFTLRLISSSNHINYKFELYLKNNNKISLFKYDNTNKLNFYCRIYTVEYKLNNMYIIPFEQCDKLLNNENYIMKSTDIFLFECINKNNLPIGYFYDPIENIAIKCNNNCYKCTSFFNCLECKDNYFLINNKCIKNKNENCSLYLNYSECKKCKSNNFNILPNGNLNCFDSCSDGCNTCNSQLYNECLSCSIGYLYYPEIKQCISGTYCEIDYSKINNDCISNCKNKISNTCKSCNSKLNLNISLNKCIICELNSGYFKNSLIKDIENKETCEKCNETCRTCIDNKFKCTSCADNKFLIINQFTCINLCPDGYYLKEKLCILCNQFCTKCNNENCLKCSNNKIIKNKICVSNCGMGYFEKNKICYKCINNCEYCKDNIKCLKCDISYIINKNNTKCLKCNLANQIIINNKCFYCSDNCKTCEININNCSSCQNNMILIQNREFKICKKKCNNELYFDIYKNKCIHCKFCKICYLNFIKICDTCPKCNNNCILKYYLTSKKLIIYSTNNFIDFNSEFKIKNYNSFNQISFNKIIFKFHKDLLINYLNLNLNNKLIKNSNDCIPNFIKEVKYIKKQIPNCEIKFNKLIFIDNKIFIKFETNFLLIKNFKFIILIYLINREINYKIIEQKVLKNKILFNLQIFPNYFKPKFQVLIKINNKYIKNIFCNLNNDYNASIPGLNDTYLKLNSEFNNNKKIINNYKINKKFKWNIPQDNIISIKFKTDSDLKNKILNKKINFEIINNDKINKISKNIKSAASTSSIVLILLNILNNANLFLFLSLLQLVNILEFILWLPIDLGGVINLFIYYFKLDFDIDIDINFILWITEFEIKKFYDKIFIYNAKLTNIKWINIKYVQLDIIFILIFYFVIIIMEILKYWKFSKLNIYIKIFYLKIRWSTLKFIESLKSKIISILIVYLYNSYNFNITFDNFKILIIITIYYLILADYIYFIINTLIKIKKNKKILYEEFFKFNSKFIDRYSLFEILNLIKEINFVIIIFLLRNYEIHVFLFFINELIFVTYLFFLDSNRNYFEIMRTRFEEIINLLLIFSIILNVYFKLKQFQLLFIILYILLLAVNFLILIFFMIKDLISYFKNKFYNNKSKNKINYFSNK